MRKLTLFPMFDTDFAALAPHSDIFIMVGQPAPLLKKNIFKVHENFKIKIQIMNV